jgi:glucose-1-phosphate adenylyltransferase
MIEDHLANRADLTIACLPVPANEAREFGVMAVDAKNRITGFVEKPANPPEIPNQPGVALASMGIYVFSTRLMYDIVMNDVALRRDETTRDFGRDIIPGMLRDGLHLHAHRFQDENRKLKAYWRDVGTLDSYFETSMDLIAIDPQLNLYDRQWPIHTFSPPMPPPKFIHDEPGRRGLATNTIICPGSIISGAEITRSIIGARTKIRSYSQIEDSIIFDDVQIGRNVQIRRAIIDKNVKIPDNMQIGFEPSMDISRGLTVSEQGLTIIAKDENLERFADQ